MKTCVTLFMVLTSCYVSAQDTEYEMALKSCECLRDVKGTVESEIQSKCISTAMVDVMEDLSVEEKQYFSDYNNMKTSMIKINEILTVICYEGSVDNYLELEKKYYMDSENAEANSYYMTTQSMMQQGKYDLAAEGLEIAVQLDSTFVKAYDHLGVSYRNMEDYEKSIAAYKQSLKIFPVGKKALSNLAMTFALNKDAENSDKYYQRLIDVHPNDPEGYYGISKNYLIAGNFEDGMENVCIAHRMYVAMDSEYQKDTEQLLGMIYGLMKKEGKEKAFKKLAKKNNIEFD